MNGNGKNLKKFKNFEHGQNFLITSETVWKCSKVFDHSQIFLDVADGQGIKLESILYLRNLWIITQKFFRDLLLNLINESGKCKVNTHLLALKTFEVLKIENFCIPKKYDSGGIRTHALSDWCLKPAP